MALSQRIWRSLCGWLHPPLDVGLRHSVVEMHVDPDGPPLPGSEGSARPPRIGDPIGCGHIVADTQNRLIASR
jgi:hypothetical protein